jgi:hypothetical protein
MTLSMWINDTSVALPKAQEPFKMEYLPLGSGSRMASGVLRTQLTAMRWRIGISWDGLTQDERDTLFGTYLAGLTTPIQYVHPNGQLTLTVQTGVGSWSESQFYSSSGEVLYTIGFSVEQV